MSKSETGNRTVIAKNYYEKIDHQINVKGILVLGNEIIQEIRNNEDVDKNEFDEEKENKLRDAIEKSVKEGKLSSAVGTVLGSIAHDKTKNAIEAIINRFFSQK